jgi:alanine dehydrogenase
MRVISANQVEAALSYPRLVDLLDDAFRIGAIAPPRHHHPIKLAGGLPDATLLLMPAWDASAPPNECAAGRYLGIKSVTVFPGNGARGLPAVQGVYILLSAETGEPLAVIDAPRLTAWRTAAASALASRYLSRADASRLLLVGSGALGGYLIRAHASVRPIRDVAIWNRTRGNAESLAASLLSSLAGSTFTITVVDDLELAVRSADIVSTATLSTSPLIEGGWLAPGTHLDCAGAFRPDMRETDDEVVRRARIWVDTRVGGSSEAGDILIPLRAGVIDASKVEGDLYELARGTCPQRAATSDITMFKSVGASIEDLAAAVAVYEHAGT